MQIETPMHPVIGISVNKGYTHGALFIDVYLLIRSSAGNQLMLCCPYKVMFASSC